jgi:pimeloyl-ACP methyl ester carboxylesterase
MSEREVVVSEVPVVVVAGTFAPRLGADRFYRPLTTGRSRTAVLALKQLGMANTRESALRVHRYCQSHFGAPVTVVGHSQGALVAAWLWLFQPDWYTPPFMLAGPWAGALLCQTWFPLGAALRSMSAESRFLHEITEAYASLPPAQRLWLTSAFATGDRVVQLTSAMVPGATNVCVAPRPKHLELARQFPGITLLEGDVGHTGLPRSSLIRDLIDARIVDVHAQRTSPT